MQKSSCPSKSLLHVRIIVSVVSNAANQEPTLQDPASLGLALLDSRTVRRAICTIVCPAFHLVFAADGSVDGKLEDTVDALHLLAATFHICRAHSSCYRLTLLGGHGSQALGF